MKHEKWKPIKGYEGLYEVSTLGNVRSLSRTITRGDKIIKRIKEKILKPGITNKGYKYVNLLRNGVAKSATIHRLVALAFIPNESQSPCIDHINGDKKDNRLSNLRWCTYKENQNFTLAISHRKTTPIRQLTEDGSTIKIFDSISAAEKETTVSHSNICACCQGKRKFAGGYRWEYV